MTQIRRHHVVGRRRWRKPYIFCPVSPRSGHRCSPHLLDHGRRHHRRGGDGTQRRPRAPTASARWISLSCHSLGKDEVSRMIVERRPQKTEDLLQDCEQDLRDTIRKCRGFRSRIRVSVVLHLEGPASSPVYTNDVNHERLGAINKAISRA